MNEPILLDQVVAEYNKGIKAIVGLTQEAAYSGNDKVDSKLILLELDRLYTGLNLILLKSKIIAEIPSGMGWLWRTSEELKKMFENMKEMGYLENTDIKEID